MDDDTRGCIFVAVILIVAVAGLLWYCMTHGCCLGDRCIGGEPAPTATPRMEPTPTAVEQTKEWSGRVAVLDESDAPEYLDGSVGNAYENALRSAEESGLDADVITSDDIEAGALSGYDILILPDNAPPMSAVDEVVDWWRQGHHLVASGNAGSFLIHSGLLYPDFEGEHAGDWEGELWDHSSSDGIQIEREACLTAGYVIGEELESNENDALLYVEALPPTADILAVDVEQPDKAAAVLYRGEGTLAFIGPAGGLEHLQGILENTLACVVEEGQVIDEIREAIAAQGYDWVAGPTSASLLTDEEAQMLCGDTSDHAPAKDANPQPVPNLPSSIDWRDHLGKDWTSAIKDQRRCGSCVAYGAVAVLESVLKIAWNIPDTEPDLSEQTLFLCGCGKCCGRGWRLEPAAEFLRDTGVPDEDCWEYTARNASCDPHCQDWQDVAVKGVSIRRLTSPEEMKRSLVENGPILGGMDVYQDFRRYKGGIYEHAWGEKLGGHAIAIVGYNDEEGYWIVKNSWGTGWGEGFDFGTHRSNGGWFRMGYGEGIYDYAYEIKVGPAPESEALIVGSVGGVDTLDPADSWSFGAWEVHHNTMDTLVTYVPGTTQVQAALAESWEVKDEGLEYIFYLREGLEFPDGTPFTAEAVEWSVERVMRLGGGTSFLVTDVVDYVEAVDDYIVRFVLKEPTSWFVDLLATPAYAPVSPWCYPEDDFDPESTCGGIGHYLITGYEPGVEIELEANPDYYGDAAESPNVVVRYYPDSEALREALEYGEVDVAWNCRNPLEYEEFLGDPTYNVYLGPSSSIRLLAFNTDIPPFDEPRVRQAIEYAVDRQLIADVVFGGMHQPLFSLIPEGVAFHAEDGKPYDPQEALVLLEEAGYGGGYPLEVELWWASDHYGDTEAELAEMLERSLESTGAIDVELRSLTWAEYIDSFISGELPLFLLRWIPDYPSPDNYAGPLVACDNSRGLGINYCDAELERLIEEARSTTDEGEREELYYEIQELWGEHVPFIPLTQQSLVVVSQADVDGIVLDPGMFLRYWRLFKEWVGDAPAAAPEPAPAVPEVSLELLEGEVAVVVEGRISDPSFDGLQVLGREPGADGKTRIDVPDIMPDDAGEISFHFTKDGQRYKARIKVTYSDGSRSLTILGVAPEAP